MANTRAHGSGRWVPNWHNTRVIGWWAVIASCDSARGRKLQASVRSGGHSPATARTWVTPRVADGSLVLSAIIEQKHFAIAEGRLFHFQIRSIRKT